MSSALYCSLCNVEVLESDLQTFGSLSEAILLSNMSDHFGYTGAQHCPDCGTELIEAQQCDGCGECHDSEGVIALYAHKEQLCINCLALQLAGEAVNAAEDNVRSQLMSITGIDVDAATDLAQDSVGFHAQK